MPAKTPVRAKPDGLTPVALRVNRPLIAPSRPSSSRLKERCRGVGRSPSKDTKLPSLQASKLPTRLCGKISPDTYCKKDLRQKGVCCYSIVTHWESQCNGLCKRTKDIVRNVGTFGYLSWVRVHCVTCPRRGDIRGSHGHRRTTTTGTSFRPMPPTPSPMPPRQPSPQAATANKTRNKDLRTAPHTLATALSP